MKQQKVEPMIVDVTREGMMIYGRTGAEPVAYKFGEDEFLDLEVVSKETLKNKLQAFIVANKIKAGPVMIILEESVYFAKDFPGMEPAMDDVQKFIDTVPFATVSSKVFRVGNTHKLIVINRDLYETLQQVFERMQFTLVSVVPGFVLGLINAPPKFSLESCKVIYKKLDEVLENSFSGISHEGSISDRQEAWLEKHKIIVIILTIAAVGMAITAGIVLTRRPVRKAVPVAIAKPTPVQEIEPTIVPTVSESEIDMTNLSAQILNGSGTAGRAASWEAKLREWGVTNIKTGNGPTREGALVVFSDKVSEKVRQKLVSELEKDTLKVSATESAVANFDVILTLGK